jgi:hypothetical protein
MTMMDVMMGMIQLFTIVTWDMFDHVVIIFTNFLLPKQIKRANPPHTSQTFDSYWANVPINWNRVNNERMSLYFRRKRIKRRRLKLKYRYNRLMMIISFINRASKGAPSRIGTSKGGPESTPSSVK